MKLKQQLAIAASGRPLINSIARSPVGTVTLGITKPTDAAVIRQGTENFTLWTNLLTNSQPAGSHNLVAPNAALLPRRHYRLQPD
jgi:hypothetical protein